MDINHTISFLLKEMEELKNNFDTEKRCRADLESKVVQMNQIISTAQEALQQEQKTVELLRQQIRCKQSAITV